MDRARKSKLRVLNRQAWEGSDDVYPTSKTPDSSLKKNTAFIKRLRTAITAATLGTFLQEIQTLSLHKYLSEIISACYEGLCKLKSAPDIDAGAEIVSSLHQRFGPGEFTENLGWLLGKGLATPDRSYLKTLQQEAREREEKDRLGRQRSLLRVVTELWLVGVLKTLDDTVRPDDATKKAAGKLPDAKSKAATTNAKAPDVDPFPLDALKDLLGHDREHTNLPLLVIFVKAFSWDVLGIKPAGSDGRKTVEEDGTVTRTRSVSGPGHDASSALLPDSAESDQPLVPPEIRERFKNVIRRYFEDVKAHIIRDQKAIISQGRRNAEAYVRSGEVFEDRQASYEKQVKAQERLVLNAQVIADAVGAEMPDLNETEAGFGGANGSVGLVKAGEYLKSMGEGAGIWEDEEERRFYENLVDLKGKVPTILLEDGKKKKQEVEDGTVKRTNDSEQADSQRPSSSAEGSRGPEPADDQSLAIANKTIGAQVDVLLARLPDLIGKDLIDETAIDFCFLNSKASRNRLVKALTDVPKGRADLLPSWSRLVATLGRYMPDIPKGLVDYLDAEFRSLQRRKDKDFLGQVRLGNIRYLAELTKFGVVPEHVVFHCLKVSLDDFSRTNIEIICSLLENCGRYLLRNPDTSPRMAKFLETLQRKKSAQHLGQQERMLIENAVYHVDPPERPAIQQKERTPMELFIRKLVYNDMTKRNYNKILRQLRKLHWEEPEVVEILENVFSKPAKIKYGDIHILAILLGALYRYHPQFVVRVIDNVIESISVDIERNDFRFYQRRLAEAKYLSELYNYRMLEHPVIFDTMYKIVMFGYGGPPVAGKLNPFDLPDDYFRIRLVATILETCGMFFHRGTAGQKLDYFLSFFQYYIHTKTAPPMDIDFIVQDVFALTRPKWKLAASLEEAAKTFQLAIAQDQKVNAQDQTLEDDERVTVSSDDDDGDGDGDLGDMDEESSADESPVEQQVDDRSFGEEDVGEEGEDLDLARSQNQLDPEEVADFEREFTKMMAESLESRKFDRKPAFDLALPMRSKTREASSAGAVSSPAVIAAPAGDVGQENAGAGPKMAFSLLTKKGNRQQTKTVELPSDANFAVAMRNQQQADREEQQRIKNLVLDYDRRENEEEEEEEEDEGDEPASFLPLTNPDIYLQISRQNQRTSPQPARATSEKFGRTEGSETPAE